MRLVRRWSAVALIPFVAILAIDLFERTQAAEYRGTVPTVMADFRVSLSGAESPPIRAVRGTFRVATQRQTTCFADAVAESLQLGDPDRRSRLAGRITDWLRT